MFKPNSSRGLVVPRARPKTLLLLSLAAFISWFFVTPHLRGRTSVVIWSHDDNLAPAPPQVQKVGSEQLASAVGSARAKPKPASVQSPDEGGGAGKASDSKNKAVDDEEKSTHEWENQQGQDPTDDEVEQQRQQDEAQKLKDAEEAKRKKKVDAEADAKRRQKAKEEQERLKKQNDEVEQARREQSLRDEFAKEYESSRQLPASGAIYGNTLDTLAEADRPAEFASRLRASPTEEKPYAKQLPVYLDPYPDYNTEEWNKTHRPYVPCVGAHGEPVEDLMVFKGHPLAFPKPSFGGFDVLKMDGDICYERDTRLGPYGYLPQLHGKTGLPIDWDKVKWGDLQMRCAEQNAGRFGGPKPNKYLATAYEDIASKYGKGIKVGRDGDSSSAPDAGHGTETETAKTTYETRTAILLRTYTGKKYTENDKQVIRSLISELSLRSGGEYQVFLLLHVRDDGVDINEGRQRVLDEHIPREFHGITEVWNDQAVWDIYTALTDGEEKTVHHAQWLSVQKFSLDHPEYDFVWNWEMDVRITGHNYDFVRRLEDFARAQPRRGLWERNERYYIPAHHGAYDTDFRAYVEQRTQGDQVWGAPNISFINPVGPKPPVEKARDEPYRWGVGEDADLITMGPIFDPVGSGWIFGDKIWGYKDAANPDNTKLPRRTTIVTQSRISKRLLDIMHVENLRGNHIASEMTPQTVALLHGFKAVFAPHPSWFDRPWSGSFLEKWFNPGPRGASGGEGSPMGYGRERRYQGTTWYYRAEPPSRLYNNWMGYIDTDVGGRDWEVDHGRPCLPPMILHPIKEVEPTEPGYATKFELNYG
ncbi:hypothetical protein CTRI78_v000184 [Colletotrichum trifolii]|uniref:Reticulocyte-binding protein 2-like protein a n=1 Tax=Colletotrichum trifolii TaxID=5466 RepID=A0A4R8RSY2_COLTR|nr:hypothetical protein CTRI78_v000184 [Colletotrichum trifolii]